MKPFTVILLIIILSCIAILTARADDFCKNQWPDSIQMQEYCIDRQERYLYVVATTYDLIQNDYYSKRDMDHCIFMNNIDGLVDWELMYMCFLTIE